MIAGRSPLAPCLLPAAPGRPAQRSCRHPGACLVSDVAETWAPGRRELEVGGRHGERSHTRGCKRRCLTEVNREKRREVRKDEEFAPCGAGSRGLHESGAPRRCQDRHTDASRAFASRSGGRRGQSCGVSRPFARKAASRRCIRPFNIFDTRQAAIRSPLRAILRHSSTFAHGPPIVAARPRSIRSYFPNKEQFA